MTTPTWTPESVLLLTIIALAIVILVLGEMIEARRARRVRGHHDTKRAKLRGRRVRQSRHP